MRIVSGSMYEGTPGTGPSMVNLAEEEMDEETKGERRSGLRGRGRKKTAETERINDLVESYQTTRLCMYTPDQTIRQIAADFEFTVDEVQAYYNRCGEMGRTRTRFQNMRELLTIKFPDDE
ncbi:hypothetical protein B0H14DRAFT_3884477 [Mycena olivaceomarginata]|nr:hypothetical protein B0H14DRAFT_3884477 [Mycena olivaceomarginata]